MSNKVLAVRIARLVMLVGAIACVACADGMTSPSPVANRAKATRDDIQGDTTTCLFGYVIISGWYRCN